jgi:polyhydroxyalkanoate synthase subunit PhaC
MIRLQSKACFLGCRHFSHPEVRDRNQGVPHPMSRIGPRPLPLHLLAAGQMWTGALIANLAHGSPVSKPESPLWNTGLMPCRQSPPNTSPPRRSGEEEADQREPKASSIGPTEMTTALQREIQRRADVFLDGLTRYRNHPYRRDLVDPPAIWSEGSSRLLDHGTGQSGTSGRSPDRTVLVVPSLINRGYILDLSAGNSLMRMLAEQGLRPLRLEWGAPGPVELRYTMTDIVAGRLERAAAAATRLAGRSVPVVGYCMGGTLIAALACRRPDLVRSALFLATPWDFHADGAQSARLVSAGIATLGPMWEQGLPAPVDLLQALFMTIDPLMALKKFTKFAAMPPDSARARAFVALEDWLNDGVDLPGPIARACFEDWYGRNDTGQGRWMIAGAPVKPTETSVPSLHIIADQDRLVPPHSSLALADTMPGAGVKRVPFGHIGMIAGRSAAESVWPLVADWLLDCTDCQI